MQQDNLPAVRKKPKVLIYLFGSLGDTLVAIPALRAVRRFFDSAELIVLQNIPAAEGIVKTSQVIPADLVDGFLEYRLRPGKFRRLGDLYELRRQLRRDDFEAAVYLIISERPAHSVGRDRLFFRSCGVKRFYGFHPFSKTELYPADGTGKPSVTENEAVRKLTRLENDGISSLPDDFKSPWLNFSTAELEKADAWLETRRRPSERLISIAPGCKTTANAWSADNFREIGRRLISEGNCRLIVVGGQSERQTAADLVGDWGAGINAAGCLTVRESGAILSRCDFHIGLDTGTTHLAAAVGIRCFALYGERNNPGQWFPNGGGHTVVYHPVECAGCRLEKCPLENHPCLRDLSVESVWTNLKEFMRNTDNNGTAADTKIIAV